MSEENTTRPPPTRQESGTAIASKPATVKLVAPTEDEVTKTLTAEFLRKEELQLDLVALKQQEKTAKLKLDSREKEYRAHVSQHSTFPAVEVSQRNAKEHALRKYNEVCASIEKKQQELQVIAARYNRDLISSLLSLSRASERSTTIEEERIAKSERSIEDKFTTLKSNFNDLANKLNSTTSIMTRLETTAQKAVSELTAKLKIIEDSLKTKIQSLQDQRNNDALQLKSNKSDQDEKYKQILVRIIKLEAVAFGPNGVAEIARSSKVLAGTISANKSDAQRELEKIREEMVQGDLPDPNVRRQLDLHHEDQTKLENVAKLLEARVAKVEQSTLQNIRDARDYPDPSTRLVTIEKRMDSFGTDLLEMKYNQTEIMKTTADTISELVEEETIRYDTKLSNIQSDLEALNGLQSKVALLQKEQYALETQVIPNVKSKLDNISSLPSEMALLRQQQKESIEAQNAYLTQAGFLPAPGFEQRMNTDMAAVQNDIQALRNSAFTTGFEQRITNDVAATRNEIQSLRNTTSQEILATHNNVLNIESRINNISTSAIVSLMTDVVIERLPELKAHEANGVMIAAQEKQLHSQHEQLKSFQEALALKSENLTTINTQIEALELSRKALSSSSNTTAERMDKLEVDLHQIKDSSSKTFAAMLLDIEGIKDDHKKSSMAPFKSQPASRGPAEQAKPTSTPNGPTSRARQESADYTVSGQPVGRYRVNSSSSSQSGVAVKSVHKNRHGIGSRSPVSSSSSHRPITSDLDGNKKRKMNGNGPSVKNNLKPPAKRQRASSSFRPPPTTIDVDSEDLPNPTLTDDEEYEISTSANIPARVTWKGQPIIIDG